MSSSSGTAGGHDRTSASTPATDISPPRSPDFVLPPPTPETLRRRAQSDRASSEIGARMLKGWAMLSDECINDDCWAIPLVRPPRARPGAQPDPRKECVVCGTVYVTDENGQLVAQTAPKTRASAGPSQTANKSSPVGQPNEAIQPSIQDVPRQPPATIISSPAYVPETGPPIIIQPSSTLDPTPRALPTALPNQGTSFASATEALGGTLDLLSKRLVQTSLAANMDLREVKDTAEVMDSVMRALGTARQLARNA